MSEDKDLKRLAEERRKAQKISERIQQGYTQTRDGRRIYLSPKGDRVGVVPRTVDAKLSWEHLLEIDFQNASFVSQYSYEAFARVVITNILPKIPKEDRDEQFNEELEKAIIKIKYPSGRYAGFGGQTYEIMETTIEYNALAILHSIVNLMRRRGTIITPRLWEENLTEVFWAREGKNKPVERIKQDEVIEDAKE